MRRKGWYAALVLLAGCSYGVVSAVLKTAYARGLTVAEVTGAQYDLAVAALWLLALFQRPWRVSAIPRRQWALLALLGVAGAGTTYGYYKALNLLPASLGIVILFQFTWMVLGLDIVSTRRLPSAAKWAGMALILAGTVLAVGLSGWSGAPVTAGAVLLALGSAFAYAVTLHASGSLDPAVPATFRSAVTVTVSALAIAIPFPPTYLPKLWSGPDASALWLWGGLVALFSQVVPLLLLVIGVPHIGGRMAGVLGSIELPVAVTAARCVLGEAVDALRWLGVALILAGIVVSEWSSLRPPSIGLPAQVAPKSDNARATAGETAKNTS